MSKYTTQFVITDEVHTWLTNSGKVPLPVKSSFVYPAGGETANQMGAKKHGQHGNTQAHSPYTQAAALHSATKANDPGDPWAAVARALNPYTREGARESQLEVVETDLPILAFRVARLGFRDHSKPFGAVAKTDCWFGVDAQATCFGGYSFSMFYGANPHPAPGHKVPDANCTCGFYATPLGKEPYSHDGCLVRLLVELSGDVIECEYLYRAEHQRVVECQVPCCRYCGRVSNVINVCDDVMQQAACEERHLTYKSGVVVTVDDLAHLLPVPVTQLEER